MFVLFDYDHIGCDVRAISRPGSQLLGANGRDDGAIVSLLSLIIITIPNFLKLSYLMCILNLDIYAGELFSLIILDCYIKLSFVYFGFIQFLILFIFC